MVECSGVVVVDHSYYSTITRVHHGELPDALCRWMRSREG